MLMIVAHHFAYGENFSFPTDTITANRLWIQLINMGGKLGVNIFVLISGYFLITSNGVKVRKLVRMWSIMLFYSAASYVIFVMSGAVSFRLHDALYALMPLTKSRWWFLTVYFMMYLLHPYINIVLKSLSKSEYERMLILLTICWSVIPTLTNSFLASNALTWFIYLYGIAGYIKLWADDFGSRKYIYLSVILIAVNFLMVIIFDVIGFRIKIFASHPLHLYNTQMLPTLIIPVCMFIGFTAIDTSVFICGMKFSGLQDIRTAST